MANPAQDALNAIRSGALAGVVTAGIADSMIDYIRTGRIRLPGLPPEVEKVIIEAIGAAESQIGGPLFETIVVSAMGLPGLGSPGSQEEAAVNTIRRAIGFGAGFPLLVGRLEAPLKALLGNNLGKELFEALREIPNELGINFFLGTALERIFETAVGTPLEEAIAERTRPQRFDFRVIKQLLKAHRLSEPEAREYLARTGYRDRDIDHIVKLNDANPGVGELQQAFVDGLRDEGWVRGQLEELGFKPEIIDLYVELYLRRAETAGGDALRNVARTGFVDDHLTEEQYRAILERVHVPPLSADLDVEAARLTKSWRQHQLTVGELKGLHAAGVIDDAQASIALIEHGYTDTQSTQLLASWQKAKKIARSGLDINRILGYLVGGVLTKAQAYSRLINLDIRGQDAQLLVDHPESWGGIYPHQLTEKTVVSAFLDEIIDDTEARALMTQIGIDPEEQDLQLEIAGKRKARGPKPKQAPHRTITEAQVIEAYRFGLVEAAWAERELVTLGYSHADAQLIIAIEDARANKAPPAGWVTLN